MSIELRGVGYRYAGARRPAILDVDLVLADGEVLGLVGASEAGKSTLCLVVSGLAPRVIGGMIRGHVAVDGEDVAAWPMHRLSSRIAIGFQNPTTQLSGVATTVFEEVAFGPMNLALPRDEVLDRTWEALATLRIADLAEREPARLSGGQQQLVAIAGLLALRPKHLVLDEPTAQLDPAGTQLVGEALARLAESGASILVAEQKTDLLAAICSRVAVVEGGKLVLDGPSSQVLADPRLPELGVPAPSRVALASSLRASQLPASAITRVEAAMAGPMGRAG